MKCCLFFCIFLMLAATAAGGILFSDGISDYVIVLDSAATAPERHAASELQKYVALCSGVTLPIVGEPPARQPALLVGHGPAVMARLPGVTPETFEADEIFLKTIGDDLVITGGRPRGVIYAVDHFLEDCLGVRWWTPEATRIPQLAEYHLPQLDYRYRPPFFSRDAFYANPVHHPQFAVKMKLNGHTQQIPDELGGNIRFLGWCHTFGMLLPPERYFESHPEWYAQIAGKRIANGQLCLTNRTMGAELIANARQWLNDNPGQRLISISQNDCHMVCACPECTATVARLGNQSDLLLEFVNQVAEELETSHPGVIVETLAYQYTIVPPQTVRPRHNVMIRLCAINANEAWPLDSDRNADFRDQLIAWSAIAPQLAVWNYLTNFSNYLAPHPNWRCLAADLRTMAEHRTTAVFQQGDVTSKRVGDLNELRAWLVGKLLWNPMADPEALIDEFLTGYYGAAAPYVKEYITIADEELYANLQPVLSCYMQDTGSWLSLEGLLRMRNCLADAGRTVASDRTLSERIGCIALMLDFSLLNRFEATCYNKDPVTRRLLAGLDLGTLLDRSFTRARELGVQSYSEMGSLDDFELLLRGRVGCAPETAIPDICRGLPEADWVAIPIENAVIFGDFSVDDPSANDGKAIRMRNDFYSWAVQLGIPRFPDGRQRDFYLRCRVTGTPCAGYAFDTGLYDHIAGGVFACSVKSDQVFGEHYVYIRVGTSTPSGNSYLYITPVMNAEEQFIWIDELLLIAR